MNTKGSFEKDYFAGYYDLATIEGEDVARQKLGIIKKAHPSAKKILDVACAYGDFLKICEDNGFQTFGGDISSYALSLAKKKSKAKLFQFNAQKEKLPFNDKFFDVVTVFDLVEHLSDCQHLFQETHRILKKGGLFFISTYNKQGKLFQLVEKLIWKRIFQEDRTHINVQNYRYWEQALEKAGFEKITSKGILLYGFPPSVVLRQKFARWRLPTLKKIIFSPFPFLWGNIYILARK